MVAARARRAVSVVGFASRRMRPSIACTTMGSVGSLQFCLCRIKKTDLPSRYYSGLGRVGAIWPKSDQENRPSITLLLWARSGRVGSAASQIGMAITTSDVTHAIGGSVEHRSAIPCHTMFWRDVTLQFVLYFDLVFDVIAYTSFWGHPLGDELRDISEVHGRYSEGL